MKPHVILAGISVRAMAQSAAAAGFEVTAVDAFGDLDTRRAAGSVFTPRGVQEASYSAGLAVRLTGRIEAEYVAYSANFENEPEALSCLMRGRTLLGNDPVTLREVRSPFRVRAVLEAAGHSVPDVLASAPRRTTPEHGWLLKARRGGGGRGIRPWHAGLAVRRDSYLQERVDGVPGSIVFVADGREAVPLGCSRQLIGLRPLGARGFIYAGNILAPLNDPQLPQGREVFARARDMASVLTDAFGLRGVNGIDFVARDGIPFPVEVNPRYSASLELVERAFGLSVFRCHARGSIRQPLERFTMPAHFRAVGKAVVYAPRTVTVGDTRRWLDDRTVADVPLPGDRIEAGRPICTVFAGGQSGAACEAALLARAARLYTQLGVGRGKAA
jgi:predicted ATP-grasp superfamily ATP-dependent carboligase